MEQAASPSKSNTNAQTPMPGSSDLALKYQRLATEYSKIKAQNQVLKKAIIEEQGKEASYKEKIREKDQNVRKSEQEIESLTFRNQQLTSRVEVLQNDLDKRDENVKLKQKAGSRGNKSGGSGIENSRASGSKLENSVLSQELHGKIEENAKLHKCIHEIENEYKAKIEELQQKVDELDYKSSISEEKHGKFFEEHKVLVENLHESKALLEVKLHKQEVASRESRLKADQCERELVEVKGDLESRLECMGKVLQSKVPFNDAADNELNALNCPAFNKERHDKLTNILATSTTLVTDMVNGLLTFYSSIDSRCKAYPPTGHIAMVQHQTDSTLTVRVKLVCKALKAVKDSYNDFYDEAESCRGIGVRSCKNLSVFARSFHSYAEAVKDLLPLQLHHLEEESALPSCPSELLDYNSKLHEPLCSVVEFMVKIDCSLQVICHVPSRSGLPHQKASSSGGVSSCSVAVDDLVATSMKLQEAVKELCKQYNHKMQAERDLPTVPAELGKLNEDVVGALVSVITVTGKLSTFLVAHCRFMCDSGGAESSHSGRLRTLRDKSARYISQLQSPPCQTVPYKLAVDMMQSVQENSNSLQSLAKQLSTYKDKVARLEQDKEHWKLEFQLLQMKSAKAMGGEGEGVGEEGRQRVVYDSVSSQPIGEAAMLGRVQPVTDGTRTAPGTSGQTREDHVKDYFMTRFTELNCQIHLLDGKAMAFYNECQALQHHLRDAKQRARDAETQLADALQRVNTVRDELQTTSTSYEAQLATMSEHLANMNDKLAGQRDEIDALKLQLQGAATGNNTAAGGLGKKKRGK